MNLCKSIIPIIILFLSNTVISQEGLVGYWSFDDTTSDTIIDHSQYANHGTNYGAQSVAGVTGNALSFDGVDDYVRIPGNGQTTPSILHNLGFGSISVWFKVDHIPTNYGIAPIFYYGVEEQCDFFDAANKGLIIELGHSPIHYGSERLYFTIWKNGCTYPSFCFDSRYPVSVGEWHHFVAVVGENYNTGYFDGEEMTNRRYNFGNAQYSQFFDDALAHEELWIGKGHWDRTTQYFDGAIDELRIYKKALTKSEVQNLFNLTAINTSSQLPSVIRLYPNPASDILSFDLTALNDDVQSIIVSDVSGKVMIRTTMTKNQNGLDISYLPDGIYIIEFQAGKKIIREKFMIKR